VLLQGFFTVSCQYEVLVSDGIDCVSAGLGGAIHTY
jgi:hypothetical protein